MNNFVPALPRNSGLPAPTGTQAERVFAKFGGVPALYKALKRLGGEAERNVSAIYRWNLPKKNGGSNGLVPTSALADVLRAARLEGIVITPEDLFPSRAG